jgi:hypothetical protein
MRVIRVLAYAKGCPGKDLIYSNNKHLSLVAYSDVSYAGNRGDKKFTDG